MSGSVRVNAELIDAVTGRAVWCSHFEHSAADLIDDEREIAQQITTDVENTLRTRREK